MWLEDRSCLQVDLNRDFPDPIERGMAGVVEPSGSEQPETLALMRWIREGRFVVSASLHEVGSYPPSCSTLDGLPCSQAPLIFSRCTDCNPVPSSSSHAEAPWRHALPLRPPASACAARDVRLTASYSCRRQGVML